MKIAIIGAGISGLTAAYLLHNQHDVHVYEANDYIGGHTATVDINLSGKEYSVDTGFIVYNNWTYPNFCKLIGKLGILNQPTEMGFSVTTRAINEVDFEYCGSTFRSLFADHSNIVSFPFIKMLWDINRFNKIAKKDLENNNIPPNQSLKRYLSKNNYGQYFINYYIYPMASAIWSAPTAGVKKLDALFFIQFFNNHGLLNISDRPRWRVISKGAKEYIFPLIKGFKEKIRLSNPVLKVQRTVRNVMVSCNQEDNTFDQVIFACHSNQALDILSDSCMIERQLLESIPYNKNSVILHTDETLLPKRRKAWTSWNYLLTDAENEHPVLTYNMNILQGLQSDIPICVTVNGEQHIDQSKILRKFTYSHPQFSSQSVLAQKRWKEINGQKRTWFCGAYWGNGFHEDGVVSALRIAEALGGDSL